MDKKDLQIMEIYAQNCRIPTTTIAKALKLSKDTISYKINNLIKQKHIKQNILFIDSRVLGFTRYHILLRFDIGVKNKQDIIKLISNSNLHILLISMYKKNCFCNFFKFFLKVIFFNYST